jgi:hypothetical protein
MDFQTPKYIKSSPDPYCNLQYYQTLCLRKGVIALFQLSCTGAGMQVAHCGPNSDNKTVGIFILVQFKDYSRSPPKLAKTE